MGETYWIPTCPSDEKGVENTLYQIEPSKLLAPDVTRDDIFCALTKNKTSVSPKDIQRHIDWTNLYG